MTFPPLQMGEAEFSIWERKAEETWSEVTLHFGSRRTRSWESEFSLQKGGIWVHKNDDKGDNGQLQQNSLQPTMRLCHSSLIMVENEIDEREVFMECCFRERAAKLTCGML